MKPVSNFILYKLCQLLTISGVGKALTQLGSMGIPREELFLQTKFTALDGQDLNQPLPYDRDAPLTTQVTFFSRFIFIFTFQNTIFDVP